MRISTTQIYTSGLDSLQKHTRDVMDAQRQISSGKRFGNASDNSLAAGLGVQVDFDTSQFEMFKVNQDYARISLSSAETQIESIGNAIDRFRTLMVQASADSIGAEGRKLIAEEMRTIQTTIRNFSVAKDANGQPILLQKDASELTKVFVAPSIDVYTSIRYEEIMGRVSPTAGATTGAFIDVDDELTSIINTVSSPTQPWLPTALQSENMFLIAKQITNAQVKVGSIENQLQAAEESSELQSSNLDQARSRLLEPDLAEATTKLAQSNALLQAAQAIMSKMDLNSLFQKL
jgi:flagellin-like hook-associated protein FlgL